MSQTAKTQDEASIVEALRAKGASRGVASNAAADLLNALKDKTSRGISISSEERSKLSDAVKGMPVQDMEIQFELNSAEISPKAKPNLIFFCTAGAVIVVGGTGVVAQPLKRNSPVVAEQMRTIRVWANMFKILKLICRMF